MLYATPRVILMLASKFWIRPVTARRNCSSGKKEARGRLFRNASPKSVVKSVNRGGVEGGGGGKEEGGERTGEGLRGGRGERDGKCREGEGEGGEREGERGREVYRGEGERGGRGERGKGKEGEGERYSF